MKPSAELLSLKGKSAIVTGGGMGIGEAIGLRLAEAGASVVIADVNEEAARHTATQIEAAGGRATAIRSDVGRFEDAQPTIEAAVRTYGRLDVLVNNAGIFPFSPALETSPELWDRVMAVNLRGTFFLCQAAARTMSKANGEGAIVNITSIDALHPTGALAHYDASKAAVAMLTRSLALEFARYRIRVNAIAPGSVNTPGARQGMGQMKADEGPSAEELLRAFLARIPLGRMGEPDDIASVALFLASPASGYMTGALVVVDGGYLLS